MKELVLVSKVSKDSSENLSQVKSVLPQPIKRMPGKVQRNLRSDRDGETKFE